MRRVVLIVAISTLIAPLGARQDTSDSQRSQRLTAGATAVVVDVVVRDSRGNPVTDLRREDFELLEDGVRQEIGDFTVVTGAITGLSSSPNQPPTTGPAGTPPSFTAIVFNRLSAEARGRAYQGALACLETLRPGDFVAVFVTDVALMTIHPYTNDRASVRKALDEAARRAVAGPVATPLPEPATATPDSPEATAATIQQRTEDAWSNLDALQQGYSTTDALRAIATGLSVLPGRKSVVFFSEGIPVPDPVLHHFRNAIATANRANVSVYTLDAAGLRTSSQQALTAGRVTTLGSADVADALRAPTEMLNMLARETGGFFVENTNDLRGAFRRVDADRRFYYLLTYTPANATSDGKWRSITVRVPGRRVDIRARSGYLATTGPSVLPLLNLLEYEAPALAALSRSPAPTDLPLRAAALIFPAGKESRLAVLAATDAKAIRFDSDTNGKFRTDFTILARIIDARGEVVRKASQPYRLSGTAAQLDEARRGEVLFFRQPTLEAGTYTLEVALHDALASKSAVRRSTFDVPSSEPGGLHVSSLVLVHHAERVKPDERDKDNPLYTGDVLVYPNLGEPLRKSSDKAATFFVVAEPAAGAAPQATIEVVQDGRTVAKAPASLPAPGSAGRIEHVFQLPLEQLPPGRYVMRMTIDAGTAREVREATFTIVE